MLIGAIGLGFKLFQQGILPSNEYEQQLADIDGFMYENNVINYKWDGASFSGMQISDNIGCQSSVKDILGYNFCGRVITGVGSGETGYCDYYIGKQGTFIKKASHSFGYPDQNTACAHTLGATDLYIPAISGTFFIYKDDIITVYLTEGNFNIAFKNFRKYFDTNIITDYYSEGANNKIKVSVKNTYPYDVGQMPSRVNILIEGMIDSVVNVPYSYNDANGVARTGYTFSIVQTYFNKDLSRDVFIVNGDNIFDFDLPLDLPAGTYTARVNVEYYIDANNKFSLSGDIVREGIIIVGQSTQYSKLETDSCKIGYTEQTTDKTVCVRSDLKYLGCVKYGCYVIGSPAGSYACTSSGDCLQTIYTNAGHCNIDGDCALGQTCVDQVCWNTKLVETLYQCLTAEECASPCQTSGVVTACVEKKCQYIGDCSPTIVKADCNLYPSQDAINAGAICGTDGLYRITIQNNSIQTIINNTITYVPVNNTVTQYIEKSLIIEKPSSTQPIVIPSTTPGVKPIVIAPQEIKKPINYIIIGLIAGIIVIIGFAVYLILRKKKRRKR